MLFIFGVSHVIEQSGLDAHVIGEQEINCSADFSPVEIGVPVHFTNLIGLIVAYFYTIRLFASQSGAYA